MSKTFEQITEQYVAEAMRGALDGFIGASSEAEALRTYADDPTIWVQFWEVIEGNWKQDRGNWISEDRQWVWLEDPDGHLPYSEQFIPIEKYEKEVL